MFSLNTISLAILALTSSAAAAPATVERSDRAITSVDFQGTLVHYYTDAYQQTAGSPTESLRRRDDKCDTSDFEPAPAPFASVSDCQTLAAYIYQDSGTWLVQPPGPVSQTKLAWSGTCAFGADSPTGQTTYIGNQDIGDLITSSISALQSGGVVCAQGNMHCVGGPLSSNGFSPVFWALYHN